MEGKAIPRMRTAARIVEEIKALDPGSEVSVYYIRQLAKSGAVNVAWAGGKALINLDEVLDLLRNGVPPCDSENNVSGGIRRVPEKMTRRLL